MITKTSTPRLRPVIRVFVSSTFSDMKHERNALAAEVYPKLEALCQKNGFQFQAIDLRWGVSTEAGLDHRTMRICFDELRRAQEISPEPNFLVLLGDRYGWRPLPEAISESEFEALERVATTKVTNSPSTPLRAGTNGEDRRGQGLNPLAVLRAWYRCDENVLLPDPPEADPDRVPLNYILQTRTRDLGDGRDYKREKDDPTKDTRDWLDVQDVLWRLINAAFPAKKQWFDGVDWAQHVGEVNAPGHPKRAIPQIARFQASATEQEIWCGALSAPNAEHHVIACFREIANRNGFTALEAKDFFDRTESGEFDETSAMRQNVLKEAIRQRLGENKPMSIPFSNLKREDGSAILDTSEADTLAFCEAVFERFRPIIVRQFGEYWNKSEKGSTERAGRELEIERDEHRRFGRERGGKESFIGREAELEAIREYLRNDSMLPLVVHGSSGCGKTALMWRAFEDIPEEEKPVIRMVGTTPHSSDIRSLLSSLCQELRQRNPRAEALPTEIKELRDEFVLHLQAATAEQPLILFLDALDQLADADNGRLLNWLPPGSLPAHVKIVVSCLSDRATGDPAGQPYAELNRRQIPAENFINLDVLTEAEAKSLLFDRWLHKAGRTVSPDQRKTIEERLTSPVCRQPIYLKLLFEEARLWRSYDAAPKLGEDVPALLKQLFDRLSQPANHTELLVDRVLGYLAASRYGLAENEILEILFADPEYKKELDDASVTNRHELPSSATRIPIAIWSRLRFDLAPYLTERAAPGANVLTFYHRQVADYAHRRIQTEGLAQWCPHGLLAMYFQKHADIEENHTWLGPNRRPFEELPHHLELSGQTTHLESTLTDTAYLDACVVLSGPDTLLNIFAEVEDKSPDIQAWETFILEHASSLRLVPTLLPSLSGTSHSPCVSSSTASYWRLPCRRHASLRLEILPELKRPNPAASVPNQAIPRITIRSSCDDIRTAVAAVAPSSELGFFLASIGHVAVIDLSRGTVLDGMLNFPSSRRLLSMAATADGQYLSLIDETGAGLCLCLTWNADRSILPSVVSSFAFTSLLPEIEDPVQCFAFGKQWWQDDTSHLVSRECGALEITRWCRLPGELRAISPCGHRLIALAVSGEVASLWSVDAGARTHRQIPAPSGIVRFCCSADNHLILLAATGETHILALAPASASVSGPRIGKAVLNMFTFGGGVLFEMPDGHIFWSGSPEDAPMAFPVLKHGSGSTLAFSESRNSIYVIKKACAFQAQFTPPDTASPPPTADLEILALCPHASSDRYSAIISSAGHLYTTGPAPEAPRSLGSDIKSTPRSAITNQGGLIWPDSPGHLFHWHPPDPATMVKLPCKEEVQFSVAGAPHEYWLVTGENEILTLGPQANCRILGKLQGVDRATPHRLLFTDNWLIWCGTSMGDATRQSADHLDTVVFFRISGPVGNREIKQTGHHHFNPENGRWTLSLWDEAAGELACFFQLFGDNRFFVRCGPPASVLRGEERVVEIRLPEPLAKDLECCTPFAGGNAFLVLSRTGWLTALSSSTYEMLGAYPINPRGKISTQAGHDGSCLISLDTLEVARAFLIHPKET